MTNDTTNTPSTLALTFLSHRAEHPDAAAALADLRALIARAEQADGESARNTTNAQPDLWVTVPFRYMPKFADAGYATRVYREDAQVLAHSFVQVAAILGAVQSE